MQRLSSIGITVLALLGLVFVGGCAANSTMIREAESSGYKTDFAVVYSKALQIVGSHYQILGEDAERGVIETQWYLVKATRENSESTADNSGSAGFGQRVAYVKLVMRLRVSIVGGDPWRVRIEGWAAKVENDNPQGMPLRGADEPPWLRGRMDSLRVELHNALKPYAVKLTSAEVLAEKSPEIDLGAHGDVGTEAAEIIGRVKIAAQSRRLDKLKEFMDPAFTWTIGAEPDRETALATWQADASRVDELAKAVSGVCAKRGSKQVICPSAASAKDFIGDRAVFAEGAGGWRLVEFVTVE